MSGGQRSSRAVRARMIVGGLAAALALAPLALAPALAAQDGDLAEVEAAFAERVVAERHARGLSGLVVREDLWAVGRDHSAAMDADNEVYHNPALREQVQNWQVVGENVGAGRTVDAVHEALMASQTHRDVILEPRFTEIGVGVVKSDGVLWVTQVFRLPEPPPESSAESPAPSTSSSSTTSSTSSSTTSSTAPPTSSPSDDRYRAAAAASARRPTGPAQNGPRPPAPPAPASPVAAAPQVAPSVASTVPPAVVPAAAAEVAPIPPPPTSVADAPVGPGDHLASARYPDLPAGSELPAAGLLAAFLIWAVVAGLARVTVRCAGWT